MVIPIFGQPSSADIQQYVSGLPDDHYQRLTKQAGGSKSLS
jgi:hypothetical protein